MVDSTWERDLAVLQVAAEAETEGARLNVADTAERLALPAHVVATVLENFVDDGWITGRQRRGATNPPLIELRQPRVLERGRRALGLWPSGDIGDALVRVIEERIADAPAEERSKFERLRDAIVAVGGATATALAVEAAKRAAGL